MHPETQVKEMDVGVTPEGLSMVDFNQATAEELEVLPGIGPMLARRIVAYREERRGFHSPEELTAVPGIGRAAYERLADRVIVTLPEMPMPPVAEGAPLEEPPEAALASPEAPVSQEMAPPEAEEAVLEEEYISPAEEAPVAEEAPLEEPPEVALVPPEVPASQEMALPEAQEAVLEKERISPAEETPITEEAPTPPRVETAAPSSPPVPVREPSKRSGLSWLWSSLVGGLLGMFFTLLVFSGINGSLDLSSSHAVLDVQNRMDNLAAEMSSLGGEIDGLRQRLDTLEGLTARMEKAESAVDTLRQETTALDQRADVLESELASVSEDLSVIQAQAQRVTTFFGQLQALLEETFGDEAATEPTPESPVETPTPTQ